MRTNLKLKFPPDYQEVFAFRQEANREIRHNPDLRDALLLHYADNFKDLISDWFITYEPRNATLGLPTMLPFILFHRQEELVDFLMACLDDQECGLIDKSRDMGATWVCCAISVALWLFKPGVSVGWGSRKQDLVDLLGDPDSIFEKMRMLIKCLPSWLLPAGFDRHEHMPFRKILNPETGSTIVGESGDNIGRGGRSTIYFVDEYAHCEHQENIDTALADNTNVQIAISTVHGTANLFHRKKISGVIWNPKEKPEPGQTRVFVLDWRDHPGKTQEWYDKRRKKAEAEGTLHLFAQEIDRDASASIEFTLIPGEWVTAAVDAHIKLKFDDEGKTIGALDVADEGLDVNALAVRKGSVLKLLDGWAQGDTGQTAHRAIMKCRANGVKLLGYDSIGVGSGVKAEVNSMYRDKLMIMPKGLDIVPWNAAASPLWPNAPSIEGDWESVLNKDFYANLKAQGWWQLRLRFGRTYQAVTKGIKYEPAELISLPSGLKNHHQLVTELSQPTYKTDGKCRILVDKKPDGTKSPNYGDAVMMAFWPIEKPRTLI